ncbi:MAG: hypothetical protein Kow0090_23110 [Myxococcota bacterium]
MDDKEKLSNKVEDSKSEEFFAEGDAVEPLSEEEQKALFGEKKKRRRNPIMALLVVILGGYIMISFSGDLSYYFQPDKPIFIGDFTEDIGFEKEFPANSFVSLKGTPDPRRAVSERGGRKYEYFLLMGTWVFVERRKQEERFRDNTYDVYFGSGRLVFMEKTGRYKNLRLFLETNLKLDIKEKKVYLLLQDEKPGDMWYIIVVYIVLLAIFTLNLIYLFNFVRNYCETKGKEGRS